jgi:hypothetical protein
MNAPTSGVTIGWIVGLLSTLVPIISGEYYEYKKEFSVCDVEYDRNRVNVSFNQCHSVMITC